MTPEESKKKLELQFADYLKRRHLRRTPERTALFDWLFTTNEPFSADTMHEQIQALIPISLATVYNTIETFLDAHIVVRRPQTVNNKAVYVRVVPDGSRYIRICTSCGQTKEFTDQKIKRLITSKSFSAFTPTMHALYLYGLCKKCQKKLNREI